MMDGSVVIEGADPAVVARIRQITDRVAPEVVPCDVTFEGMPLHVAARVFNPAKGRSTRKMARVLSEIFPPQGDEAVLDVGTGSGVLTMLSHRMTAGRLVAVDIMPEAVDCARGNFQRCDVPAEALVSDLFEAVKGQRFDVVIFNAPTAHCSVQPGDRGAVTLWDPTGGVKQRFVDALPEYLNPENRQARAVMMYSVYRDYNSLAGIDFRPFDVHKLFVEQDDLSEAGVLVLMRKPEALQL